MSTSAPNNALLGLGIWFVAILFGAPSLDTPVSHVMLMDRSKDREATVDLEKNDLSASDDFVDESDGLLGATRKLWQQEGSRGFVKGFLPYALDMALNGVIGAITTRMIGSLSGTRRSGLWKVLNLLLVRTASNLAYCILSNPASILRTRMRLSPRTRKTTSELRYLSYRMSYSEWFTLETVIPAFLRCQIYECLQAITFLGRSELEGPAQPTAESMIADLLDRTGRGIFVTMAGAFLTFPLSRCEELGAIGIKPMEQTNIKTAQYDGFADEIVKDSAWNGVSTSIFRAGLQSTRDVVLSTMLYVAFSKLPPAASRSDINTNTRPLDV